MNNNISFKIISLIRFPMICGIVFIHSKNNNFISCESNLPLYNTLTNILSDGIARICVPLFYFISGFLFFYNVKVWNFSTYCNKLKSRFNSLLLPYFIYITLAIFIFAIAQELMPQLISGANLPISKWRIIDFFKSYWRYDDENIPFVGPLWFIRNLIIIVTFSPIIYLYVTKFKKFGLLLLGITWIIGFQEFSIPGTMALFFFSSGSYFGIFKLDFTYYFNKIKLSNAYPILLLLDTFSKNEFYNGYLHRFTVILGILFFIKIMVKLQSKRTIKLPEIFVSSSFFIYAFHEPYYDQIRKVLFKFILPLSNDSFYMDIQMATYYVLTPIIYIVILIIIFLFIRHHLPRIAKILSGNRL